ncbi:MAG: hypothetical protein Q6K70_00165 [Thermostichales cyanobacterium DRC_bins_46]
MARPGQSFQSSPGWFFSRWQRFQACKRRYYYHYYGQYDRDFPLEYLSF